MLKWLTRILLILGPLLLISSRRKKAAREPEGAGKADISTDKAMFQFTFLPYFPTDHIDAKMRRLHLFNLWKGGKAYITEDSVRQRIEKIAGIYVDKELAPLRATTIAVIDENYSLAPLTDQQLKDLDRYILALLFCSIVKNDVCAANFHSICTSEHFSLFHQKFDLTEDFVGYTTGSYFRVKNVNTFDGTRLVRPDFIPDVLNYTYDSTLLEAICSMVDAHRPDDDFIFNALQWVRFALMNAEGFNYSSRVVMVSTAYEILFDLPDRKKEDKLAAAIEGLLQTDKMDSSGLPKMRKLNALGKEKENTMYGWWARDFYHLRSKIVHGSVLARDDFLNHNKVEHLTIAVKVLQFCLYKLMEAKGHLFYKEYPTLGKVGKYMDEKKLREVEKAIG